MRRRDFITMLASTAAQTWTLWPLAVSAQQSGGMARIGYFVIGSETDPEAQARHAAFRAALEKLGWADGRNVRIDYRWRPAGPVRARTPREEAADLVRRAPNVILV